MSRLALCAGSFDPLTNGHVAIIRRGLKLFDRIHVAVSVNIRKQPLFSVDERIAMVLDTFAHDPRVTASPFKGLLAVHALELGAVALLRGLRAPSDFEYELQMAHMNRHIVPELDTVFLAADAAGSYISSSLVKEVATLGGDVSALIPHHVLIALQQKLAARG